jgi:hypothetical protein
MQPVKADIIRLRGAKMHQVREAMRDAGVHIIFIVMQAQQAAHFVHLKLDIVLL